MWVSVSSYRPTEQKIQGRGGYPAPMRCVICRHDDTKVIDSRTAEEGAAIRRRRECPECSHRFTTYERIDEVALMVAKTKGGREPFDQAKVVSGILAAAKGRPIDAEAATLVAESIEEELRLTGEIGRAHV